MTREERKEQADMRDEYHAMEERVAALETEREELRDALDHMRKHGRVMPAMTLRELYTGLMMQGLLDSGVYTEPSIGADLAVAQADALIDRLQEAGG